MKIPANTTDPLALKNLVDVPSLQELGESLYQVTGIPLAILTPDGKEILVAAGWQEICLDFHRVNPQTCRKCLESDTYINERLDKGAFVEYKCKNGLWDMAMAVIVDHTHVATLFTGQFFFDEEEKDEEFFSRQARQYGFNEARYLEALRKVPVFSREWVQKAIGFLDRFVSLLAELGRLNLELKKSAESLEGTVAERTRELNENIKELELTARSLTISRKKAEEANTAKERYVQLVAHDLKAPIASCMSLLDQLCNNEEIPEDHRRTLKSLAQSQKELLELIENILSLTRLKEKPELNKFTFPARVAVTKAVMVLQPMAQQKGVELLNNVPESAQLTADFDLLTEVIKNIVSNGIKFSDKGDQVEITMNGNGDLSISDHGTGIGEQYLADLFKSEIRTTKPGTGGEKGHGLGLPLSYEIIALHGGRLAVESLPGEGTTFRISLPAGGS